MIWVTMKMILALGGLLAILMVLKRVSKRLDGRKGDAQPETGIKLLSSKLIAPQKYISLVEVGGEVLVLGVSAQQITFLTKIANPERVAGILSAPSPRPEPFSWFKGLSLRHRKLRLGPLGMSNGK